MSYLTVKELARRYKVDVSTIWRWTRANKLPSPVIISGVTRWLESEVDARDKALIAQQRRAV